MSDSLQPGTPVTILSGAFDGYAGEVLSIDGTEAQVEVEIFGRKTPVPVSVRDLHWGEVSARERIQQDVHEAWRDWRQESTMQWWKDRCPDSDSPSHMELLSAYREFQTYREDVLNPAEEQLRVEIEAALSSFPESEWNQRWDESKAEWLSRFAIEKMPRDEQLDRAGEFISRARESEEYEVNLQQWRQLQQELHAFRQQELSSEAVLQVKRGDGYRIANRIQNSVHVYLEHAQGITLPDHLIDFAAWWKGLTEPESVLWRDHVWGGPGGLLSAWAYVDDVDRLTCSHHDLLVARYYRDPPEFYTIMQGDGDGSHYGLWYDDPAEAACCIAHYWNNDPTPIHIAGSTALEIIREKLEVALEHAEEMGSRVRYLHLLEGVLDYHSATPRKSAPERQRIPTCDGMGVWVPGEESLKRDVEEIETIIEAGGKPLDEFIQHVYRELDQGRPAAALALGRDLAWLSFGEKKREELAASLMEASYRALNRDQFAITARIHQQYRDLSHVDSYDLQ